MGPVELLLLLLVGCKKAAQFVALLTLLYDLYVLLKKVAKMKKILSMLRWLARVLNAVLFAMEWLLARLPAIVNWLRRVLHLLPAPEAEDPAEGKQLTAGKK